MIDLAPIRALLAAAHPADAHLACADCCPMARTRTALAEAVPGLVEEVERLRRNADEHDKNLRYEMTARAQCLAEIDRLRAEVSKWRRAGFDGIDSMAEALGKAQQEAASLRARVAELEAARALVRAVIGLDRVERDDNFPCPSRAFELGEPDGDCQTDGHYMCRECVNADPESIAERDQETP